MARTYYISTGGYHYNNAGDRYDNNRSSDFSSIDEAKNYLDNTMDKKDGHVMWNGNYIAEKKNGTWKN